MRGRARWAFPLSVAVACVMAAPATAASTASVMRLGSPQSGPQARNLGATPVGGGYLRQRWAVNGRTLTVVGPAGTTVDLTPVTRDAKGRFSVGIRVTSPPITPGLVAAARSNVLARAGLSDYRVAKLAGIHGRMLKQMMRANAAGYSKGDTMHIVCYSWVAPQTSNVSMQNCDRSYFIEYGQGPCCEVGDAESAYGQNYQGNHKVLQLQAQGFWNYGDTHTFTERPTVVFNVGSCTSSTFTITLLGFGFGFPSTTCQGQMYPLPKHNNIGTLIGWGAGYKDINDTKNGIEGLSPTYGSTVGWSEAETAWEWMQYS